MSVIKEVDKERVRLNKLVKSNTQPDMEEMFNNIEVFSKNAQHFYDTKHEDWLCFHGKHFREHMLTAAATALIAIESYDKLNSNSGAK